MRVVGRIPHRDETFSSVSRHCDGNGVISVKEDGNRVKT